MDNPISWSDKPVTGDILELPMKETKWLWQDRFVSSGVNIVSGLRSTGKTTFLMYVAYKVLCGGQWPELPDKPIETGSVIYQGIEDSLTQSIRPKMEALIQECGGRPPQGNQFVTIQKIERRWEGAEDKTVDRPFHDLMKGDILALGDAVDEVGNVKLILLDPLIAFSGNVKANDEKSVRDFLMLLGKFAEEKKLAIIGLRHLSKDEKKTAEQRTLGSTAWQDGPRSVWLVGQHPEDRNVDDPQQIRRTLTLIKCNPAIKPVNLCFRLHSVPIEIDGKPTSGYPICCFDDKPLKMSSEEVLNVEMQKQKITEVNRAVDWLQDVLSDGPVAATQIKKMAKDALPPLAWRTVERARSRLDIVVNDIRSSSGKVTGWTWELS